MWYGECGVTMTRARPVIHSTLHKANFFDVIYIGVNQALKCIFRGAKWRHAFLPCNQVKASIICDDITVMRASLIINPAAFFERRQATRGNG